MAVEMTFCFVILGITKSLELKLPQSSWCLCVHHTFVHKRVPLHNRAQKALCLFMLFN